MLSRLFQNKFMGAIKNYRESTSIELHRSYYFIVVDDIYKVAVLMIILFYGFIL